MKIMDLHEDNRPTGEGNGRQLDPATEERHRQATQGAMDSFMGAREQSYQNFMGSFMELTPEDVAEFDGKHKKKPVLDMSKIPLHKMPKELEEAAAKEAAAKGKGTSLQKKQASEDSVWSELECEYLDEGEVLTSRLNRPESPGKLKMGNFVDDEETYSDEDGDGPEAYCPSFAPSQSHHKHKDDQLESTSVFRFDKNEDSVDEPASSSSPNLSNNVPSAENPFNNISIAQNPSNFVSSTQNPSNKVSSAENPSNKVSSTEKPSNTVQSAANTSNIASAVNQSSNANTEEMKNYVIPTEIPPKDLHTSIDLPKDTSSTVSTSAENDVIESTRLLKDNTVSTSPVNDAPELTSMLKDMTISTNHPKDRPSSPSSTTAAPTPKKPFGPIRPEEALREEFPDSEPVRELIVPPAPLPTPQDSDDEEEFVYDASLDKPNPGEIEEEKILQASRKKSTCLEFTVVTPEENGQQAEAIAAGDSKTEEDVTVVTDEVEAFSLDENFDYDKVVLTPKYSPEEMKIVKELMQQPRF